MKQELKIPTLVALVILLIGLVVTSFLTGQAQRLFLKADSSSVVGEIKTSNISDTSFTVSWVTDQPVSGSVSVNDGKGFSRPILDDRVQSGGADDKFNIHHVTTRFLKPSTSYTYKIISGSQEINDNSYKITTSSSQNSEGGISTPIYGTILKSDQSPAAGVLVYVSINNSQPLSALTKSNGNWLITLNNARDLNGTLVNFKPKGDIETITVQGGVDGIAQVKTITGNDAPVPNIVLGQNYDFSTVIETPTPTPIQTITAGFTEEPIVSPTPGILTPSDNGTLSDSQPTFQGTGIPGEVVQIIVHSDQNLSGSVVVGSDGRWKWIPPDNLTPGEHTVTIATTDGSGQTQNITKNFLVLASGTSVVESATPSATLAPTVTPSSTPTLTPTPTPVLPTSGSTSPTTLLLIGGVLILIMGMVAFYAVAI